ncbi:histidine phosphatase family protein [Psychrobacillus vulpis]|uniref:Histidine phosphatase family protein n=1 Tax=Psychrobacillus vulpis TaxID=2325572 RepID=A0A544TWF0_9BACI|nr:histidine phosphatase family protein [Psychrobacillus vulpis]TQR21778.1 histidine phosphatase family protein [Psychrobacillus vulpis]
MKKVYIIRHCQAEGQEDQAPLTEKGYNQAVQLANFLENTKVDQIISSPFLRAIQTIDPFAKSSHLDVQIDNRLSERILSSTPITNWLDKLKETFNDKELKLEGGESSNEAQKRILEVLNDILNSKVENSMIVTHGNIMSLLLNNFNNDFGFEQWKELSNPDVFLLIFSNNEFTIQRIWHD